MLIQGTLKQKGFTLIELIAVIVILGVLAATAMPKFVKLSDDARNAATNGVAGAVGSGLNMLYAACLVAPNDVTKCPAAHKTALKDPWANFSGIKLAAGYALSASVDRFGYFTLGKETYYFSQMNCSGRPPTDCRLMLKNSSALTYSVLISIPQLP